MMAFDGVSKVFSFMEVKQYFTKDNYWMIIHSKVYDAMTIIDDHLKAMTCFYLTLSLYSICNAFFLK